jgi:tripartite-type tricarboxylate transporter receptor subunit TctC
MTALEFGRIIALPGRPLARSAARDRGQAVALYTARIPAGGGSMNVITTTVAGLLSAFTLLSPMSVTAQQAPPGYPDRPVRIIITVPPGAGADMVARLTAQFLQERWGQNVVVDPRPGGGGLVATDVFRRSSPDGYTILQTGTGILFQTATKRVPFNVLDEFTPVVPMTMQPYILVSNVNVPASSIKELVALSQAKPITYAGSSGIGGTVHLGMEHLGKLSGMKLRNVPYKGSAPAYLGLLGGEVQLVCGSVMSATSLIRSGKVRGIASLGTRRAVTLPDLPTAIEQGLPDGFRIDNRYNLWVRAGTPRPIINAINRAAGEGIRSPEVAKKLNADGSEPAPARTPEELRADLVAIAKDIDAQVKELGIKF